MQIVSIPVKAPGWGGGGALPLERGGDALKETNLNIMMFYPENPKWDQTPKIYTPKQDYEHPCPFQMALPPSKLPRLLL